MKPAVDHAHLVEARQTAEEVAFGALASSPRRHRAFRRLLADAQHLVVVREEQVRDLTLAWPVMRRAALRIGEALAARGMIAEPDDAFFLTRDEALEGLRPGGLPATVDVAGRRAKREEQVRLVPPLLVGRVNPMLKKMWDAFPRLIGAAPSETALVSGAPASPGRATGPVRVIRGSQQFEELLPGEILVAPLTAPGWTPLFTRAAAVVTDVGSAAAHASIIAREYGSQRSSAAATPRPGCERGCGSWSTAARGTSSRSRGLAAGSASARFPLLTDPVPRWRDD